ncbi:SETMR methyltransferase, partial [Acromyrmex insinuator]
MGFVKDRNRQNRPAIATNLNKRLNVLQSFIEDPRNSIRKVAQQHDIKILKKEKFHPYKIHLPQELFELAGTYIIELKSNQTITRPIILREHLEVDRIYSTVDIVKELNINHKTVLGHLEFFFCESLLKRNKLKELSWEVLMHPPYNPYLASADYHLFRSLQNSFNGVNLISKEACENHLSRFFIEKSQKFCTDGIIALLLYTLSLIEKW